MAGTGCGSRRALSPGRGQEAQKECAAGGGVLLWQPLEVVKSMVIDAPLEAPKEYEFPDVTPVPARPASARAGYRLGQRGPRRSSFRIPSIIRRNQCRAELPEISSRPRPTRKPAEELDALEEETRGGARGRGREPQELFQGRSTSTIPRRIVEDRPRIWLGPANWEGLLLDWLPPAVQGALLRG